MLCENLSVVENIFLGRELRGGGGIDWKGMHDRAAALLDSFGVRIGTRTLVKTLPIAHRQIVEIAKAINSNTEVLILDEPTSSLTVNETRVLFDNLRKFKARGMTIIFISHRLNEVSNLVDQVTVLRDGEKMATAETRSLDVDQICRLIACRDMSELFPKTEATIRDVALEVRNLSGEGFRGISFKVHWGEILGIAGLVGAGRSELVRAIYGVNEKFSGEIYLEGQKVNIDSPSEAIGRKIGLLTEDRGGEGTFPELSVAKNLIVLKMEEVVKGLFLNDHEIKEKAGSLVKKLGIVTYDPHVQVVSELSGGNQQKTVLGRLIGSRPRILLLDEPTRGVDVASKTEIHRFMGQFVREGGAIVMVSSELDELLGVCDRILVLHEGNFGGLFERNTFEKESILRCMMNV
jgi:ABC-type sugar transport system ATPase subunit